MSKLERLDKILSNLGYGSRKEIKKIIKDGRVKVDDKIILENQFKVDPFKREIFLDGEKIDYRQFIYLMMNKPQGVVSATYDPSLTTVVDLISPEYGVFEPFPAGRLDRDTEGLILLTNNGKMAHRLLSPKSRVGKKYFVYVEGYVEEEHKEIFKQGLVLDDGYKTLPGDLEIIEADVFSKVYLTIYEGKFHQVKRMFQALAMEVNYLKRISLGPLYLDPSLEEGQYRELNEEEILSLNDFMV